MVPVKDMVLPWRIIKWYSPPEKFYVSTKYISRALPGISSLVSGADSATLKELWYDPYPGISNLFISALG